LADEACRIDVWLWRARFFKTRSLAAQIVESGRVHVTRGLVRTRADKPARSVKVGDELVFAMAGRLTAVRVDALGTRRGPPAEARALYSPMEES
jgi:ribosomal 50S subunit-recycling heat shock protein